MKGYKRLLLAAFVLICFNGSLAVPLGDYCSDGDIKMDDCNQCFCSGGYWACTLMACPTPDGDEEHILLKRQAVPFDDYCSDGDTKMDDCNHCFCSGGHWDCTLMACPTPVDDEEHILLKRQARECNDGEFKKIDCNNCQCTQGLWACSRMACPKQRRDAECERGQTKQDDCNACTCAKGRWACTKRLCIKNKRELPPKVLADLKNVPCSPSDTFFLDCNRCQCNFERTGYACVKAQNCTLTT